VKRAVGRRQDGRSPAERDQRARQVANDVADAADLAARQRAVLRSDNYNVPGIDDEPPRLSA